MRETLFNTTTLLGGGFSFMLLGFFFAYFPSIFRRQIAARNAHSEKLRIAGEIQKATMLKNETRRIIIQTPKYGVGMISVGAILMAIASYLPE
jgi:hypothetical protein